MSIERERDTEQGETDRERRMRGVKCNQRGEGCRQMLRLCTQLQEKRRWKKQKRICSGRKGRDVGWSREVTNKGPSRQKERGEWRGRWKEGERHARDLISPLSLGEVEQHVGNQIQCLRSAPQTSSCSVPATCKLHIKKSTPRTHHNMHAA